GTGVRWRDVAAALAQCLVEQDRAGSRSVERGDVSFHGYANDLVAPFEHQAAYAFAFAADDDRAWAAVVDLVVEHVAGLVCPDDPHALFFERIDRLPQVRNVGDHQMFARPGARLRDGGRQTDAAVSRDDNAVDAGAFRGAKQDAEVLRIL